MKKLTLFQCSFCEYTDADKDMVKDHEDNCEFNPKHEELELEGVLTYDSIRDYEADNYN